MKLLRRHRLLRWLLVPLALLALVALGGLLLPWWLIAPAEPAPADVILHYAIDPRSEADAYVAQLYEQKLAQKIVCISEAASCDDYPADEARRQLLARGIPAADVLALRLPDADCVALNLPRVIEMVKAQGWQRALLVVRPVRSRAMGSLAHKYFQQAGLQLAVTYAPQDHAGLTTRWWANHYKTQVTMEAAISGILDPWYAECR